MRVYELKIIIKDFDMNYEVLKSLTILYVEDELELQTEVKYNISPFVKEIITKNNGQDGLDYFLENQDNIDMIITDILMPIKNGIEMVNEIREINYEIPIIYTTAFNDNEFLLKTVGQSIDAYILKPIDLESLIKGMIKASVKVENDRLKAKLLSLNKDLEIDVSNKTEQLEIKNKELLKQLYTDSLTNLKNRLALREDLNKYKHPIIAIFDIDQFKGINDLYGIDVGNSVLIKIANILAELSGEDVEVYRTGSDEFILLQECQVYTDEYEKRIKNIITTINSESLYINEYELHVYVDVTVGISHDHIGCLEKADIALREAQQGHLSYLMYTDTLSLDSKYENDIKWTEIIREAVANNNIVPYYQPIVDKDENIIKYESLMRLIDKDEVISPFFFLEISKKAKFYSIMMKMMIKQTFNLIKKTQKDITINLSIQDIYNKQMVEYIKSELIQLQIAKNVIFEITESESINDYEKVYQFIIEVKKLGCRIAIDDFGSGYSNFSYILKLQPDYLKIDGSLIKDIHINENSFIITRTIAQFAQQLGIQTIAEYVHNEEVFEILKKLKIDAYQGFYFSEPKEFL